MPPTATQEHSDEHSPVTTFPIVGIGASAGGLEAINALFSGLAVDSGITFAQDATAKFSSMPQAAVELGGVDFVLPPEKIAEELARISQHPFMANQPQMFDEKMTTDEASLKQIFQLLNTICNVDFTHYKRGTLTRRLARRIPQAANNNQPIIRRTPPNGVPYVSMGRDRKTER